MNSALRKILASILSLLTLCSLLTVGVSAADEPLCSGDFCYKVEDGKVTVTEYHGTDTEVTVPATIDNMPVTAVGYYCFDDSDDVVSVTVSEGIETLEDKSFSGMANLQEIILPDSLLTIGNEAFTSCAKLQSFHIPKGVRNIGTHLFYGWNAMESITVSPDNKYFSSKDGVLYNKNGTLLQLYPVGKKDASFAVPEGVAYIGATAFFLNENLTNITLPEGLTAIGAGAFFGCDKLTGITLPDSLMIIADNAFYGCESLTSISLGKSLEILGDDVFAWCYDLEAVEVDDENKNYYDTDGVLFSAKRNALILYPSGKTDSVYTVPDGTQIIGESSFWYAQHLGELNLPDSLYLIESSAFSNCQAMTKINLGNGVARIESNAFMACFSLKEIALPDSVIYIGEDTFTTCYDLEKVTLSASIDEIPYGAFSNCTSLTTLPAGNYTKIGSEAFGECRSLNDIRIPEGVTSIGRGAFAYCRNLEKVYIPETVVEMGHEVFYNCAPDLTIYGVENSYAQQYAEENNIPFVAKGTSPSTKDEIPTPDEPDAPGVSTPDEPVKDTINYILGDADLNGITDVRDATHIQKYAAGFIAFSYLAKHAGDCDANGEVNVKDATVVQKYVAGLETNFAVGNPVTEEVDLTVYLYNAAGWQSLYCYTYSEGSFDSLWPGEKMTALGNDMYSVKINPNHERIIFIDMGQEAIYTDDSEIFAGYTYDNLANCWYLTENTL